MTGARFLQYPCSCLIRILTKTSWCLNSTRHRMFSPAPVITLDQPEITLSPTGQRSRGTTGLKLVHESIDNIENVNVKFTYFIDYFFELSQFLLTFYNFRLHFKFFIFDTLNLYRWKVLKELRIQPRTQALCKIKNI